MIDDLQVGQVLWLKVRYQIDKIAQVKHPMLVADIQDDYIEIIALDKTAGKLQNLYYPYNWYIDSTNPFEKVISEDSYAQFNTKLTIERFPEIVKYRQTRDKLSHSKLEELLVNYRDYQNNNLIKEERIVYMTKYEILQLNENI